MGPTPRPRGPVGSPTKRPSGPPDQGPSGPPDQGAQWAKFEPRGKAPSRSVVRRWQRGEVRAYDLPLAGLFRQDQCGTTVQHLRLSVGSQAEERIVGVGHGCAFIDQTAGELTKTELNVLEGPHRTSQEVHKL